MYGHCPQPHAELVPAANCRDTQIEKQFAVKVVQHMSTYWSILEKVKGSTLRLTKIDNDIIEHLQKDFPEFDPAATIDEDELKSKAGKERWRAFMMAYEKRVDDYNFGTMLRSNPKWEYGNEETIFGVLHLAAR
jgi:Polysaccharide biosynthesis